MFPVIKVTTVKKTEEEFIADGVPSDFEDNPPFSKKEQKELDIKEKELATAFDPGDKKQVRRPSGNSSNAGLQH